MKSAPFLGRNSSVCHQVSKTVHALGSSSALSGIYPKKVTGQMYKDGCARIFKAVAVILNIK